MMGVYIRGMEMPTNCGECPMICEDDLCRITKGGRTIKDRPPHCPLIEIPPHGRLIDADAFEKQNAYFWNRDFINPKYSETLADLVNAAPTIIEAEGRE